MLKDLNSLKFLFFFLLSFVTLGQDCDSASFDDYIVPYFDLAYTSFVGQDNLQIVINVDQRFRNVALDWLRAHTDELDYSSTRAGDWFTVNDNNCVRRIISSSVYWPNFFVNQAQFEQIEGDDPENYEYYETRVAVSYNVDRIMETEPGHRSMVVDTFERHILVLLFRFPRFIIVSLGNELTSRGIQINPYVFITPVGISRATSCPSCVRVILQSESSWPVRLHETDLSVSTEEDVATTLEYIPDSDVGCEQDSFGMCIQQWLLSVDPNNCAMDGLYDLQWTSIPREGITDFVIPLQYQKPSYEINLETSELCPGVGNFVIDSTIELYRDSSRDVDMWSVYYRDDVIYGTLTVHPEDGYYLLADCVVNNIFLYPGTSSDAISIVATDEATLDISGGTINFSIPVTDDLFPFITGSTNPFVIRVGGTVLVGDTVTGRRERRRLFESDYSFTQEKEITIVEFQRDTISSQQGSDVLTKTTYKAHWGTAQHVLDSDLTSPNEFRRQIEAFFSSANEFNTEMQYQMRSIQSCVDENSTCETIWTPTDTRQNWPSGFIDNFGNGYTIITYMVTSRDIRTSTTPSAEVINFLTFVDDFPSEFYLTDSFIRWVAYEGVITIYTGSGTDSGVIPGDDLDSDNADSGLSTEGGNAVTSVNLGATNERMFETEARTGSSSFFWSLLFPFFLTFLCLL